MHVRELVSVCSDATLLVLAVLIHNCHHPNAHEQKSTHFPVFAVRMIRSMNMFRCIFLLFGLSRTCYSAGDGTQWDRWSRVTKCGDGTGGDPLVLLVMGRDRWWRPLGIAGDGTGQVDTLLVTGRNGTGGQEFTKCGDGTGGDPLVLLLMGWDR